MSTLKQMVYQMVKLFNKKNNYITKEELDNKVGSQQMSDDEFNKKVSDAVIKSGVYVTELNRINGHIQRLSKLETIQEIYSYDDIKIKHNLETGDYVFNYTFDDGADLGYKSTLRCFDKLFTIENSYIVYKLSIVPHSEYSYKLQLNVYFGSAVGLGAEIYQSEPIEAPYLFQETDIILKPVVREKPADQQ